jgi:YesN/AraC family two-component response regulator
MSGRSLKALIVDDEPLARRRIRMLLESHSDIEDISECTSGVEAVETIIEHSPDLVFLDIQMPELDGFEVFRLVGIERMINMRSRRSKSTRLIIYSNRSTGFALRPPLLRPDERSN